MTTVFILKATLGKRWMADAVRYVKVIHSGLIYHLRKFADGIRRCDTVSKAPATPMLSGEATLVFACPQTVPCSSVTDFSNVSVGFLRSAPIYGLVIPIIHTTKG